MKFNIIIFYKKNKIFINMFQEKKKKKKNQCLIK